MNRTLIHQIADAIEQEPLAHQQQFFGGGILTAADGAAVEHPREDAPACLAGWAVALAETPADDLRTPGMHIRQQRILETAQHHLALTDAQAAALFRVDLDQEKVLRAFGLAPDTLIISIPHLLRALARDRDKVHP